ncbi:hypothetical protein BKH46_05910 [Helicobacter sp. 12S02634-8]|nr:hypothetical protein BKH46_05910 [Helicobacter sp. 12S02634-8]
MVVGMELGADKFLDDKYGGRASKEFLDADGLPFYSPKIMWDPIEGARSYALEIIDYDACRVSGKIFVHWVVANIHSCELKENASQENKDILQGVNSMTQGFWRAEGDLKQKEAHNLACSKYVGPMPPDKDHYYKVNVYALDVSSLKLPKPFFINDLHDAMRGHIIKEMYVKDKKDELCYYTTLSATDSIVATGQTEFRYKHCKR